MYTFMDNETYEQITLNGEMIGEEQIPFLQESMNVTIESHEEDPIGVQLPDHVALEVSLVLHDAVLRVVGAPAPHQRGQRAGQGPEHRPAGTHLRAPCPRRARAR